MEAFGNFFDFITDWLNSGVYGLLTDFAAYLIKQAVLAYLALLNFAIPFAWGIAKSILQDLNLSALINAAWDDLPTMSQAVATSFKVPEIINTAITGFVTKFVMRFIPGL